MKRALDHMKPVLRALGRIPGWVPVVLALAWGGAYVAALLVDTNSAERNRAQEVEVDSAQAQADTTDDQAAANRVNIERLARQICRRQNICVRRVAPAAAPSVPGAQGLQGDRGPRGPAGTPGAAGTDGSAGTEGEPGPAGPAGPEGPAGANGTDGNTGPRGPQGTTGDTGARGNTGPAGETGAQGPAGPQGPPGADGPACPPGTNPEPVTVLTPTGTQDIIACT